MKAASPLVLFALGMVVATGGVRGQAKASFSGTWVATVAISGPQRQQQLVIVQDDAQMMVTDASGRVLTYRLDGSESRNETTTVAGEKWGHVSHARWVSSALVITTTTTRVAGQRWDWMTIYRRDGDGALQVTTLDAVTDPGPFRAMSLNTIAYKPKT